MEKENDELLCTVRSLVTVRNQLPAQGVKLFDYERLILYSVVRSIMTIIHAAHKN